MFQALNNRCGHYALLLLVAAGLTLPNLGAPSLWDIDEGKNAEAAREMLESDNWVVPTFNYQPRYEKPALLYWLQIGTYRLFGINEFAARFPSAMAALATVLMSYELGRRMFGAGAGLIAGLALASASAFCASAHFANPDALLTAFTVLTLLVFWQGFARQGHTWFVLAGISTGLGMLAKGPIGLVLPAGVIALFLLWSRRLRLLWDRWLLLGAFTFVLTALPWYLWVVTDTKGQFLSQFILKDNVQRYLSPMEHHHGPFYYYAAVLILGFVPWSAFLALAAWYSFKQWKSERRKRQEAEIAPSRSDTGTLVHSHVFLWCWIALYLVFFSVARTKLPNYILPVYVPLAILTGRFLEGWRTGIIKPPAWALNLSLACLALIGLGISLLLLVAGGIIDLPVWHGRQLIGLQTWSALGALPLVAAAGAWWCVRRQYLTGIVVTVATVSILFIGSLFAWGSIALDAYKAPRTLVRISHAQQTDRDIRVACFKYSQPSLVFYCRREVVCLDSEEQTLEFLHCPLPVYLFVPAAEWETLRAKTGIRTTVLARHGDLYRHGDEVVVVTNR